MGLQAVKIDKPLPRRVEVDAPGADAEEAWSNAAKNTAIDIGYGFVKLFLGQQGIRFPSVVGRGRELNYFSPLSKNNQPLDNLQVYINGQDYFVGNLAIRQSELASRSLEQNRAADPNAKILLLTAVGLLSQWEDQKFNLVTGFPTSYYAIYSKEWVRELTGQYSIQLRQNGQLKPKKFSLREVCVIPQPFGTLYDQMLNTIGNIINQELGEMLVGIVDIGYKTTDYAVADRLEFIEHLSSSTTTGLASVHRLLAGFLQKNFNLEKQDFELDEIVETGTVRVAGKVQDLSGIRDEFFAAIARKIINEISSRWDYRQFDIILLTGGGGEALAQYIIPHFPNMVLVDDAQYANARGFQKLANKLFDTA
ncbi:MAG TPA: ParM/StbA family protein [Firmicutes bacterium]|nr:ParM/StbA family protein [Bacillota bacterium]